MIILGINSAYHEPSAALLVDGQIMAAAEEERFSRVKHGKRALPGNSDELPWRAIDFCLQRAQLQYGDVQAVGYSLDPWVRRRKQWNDREPVAPGDFGTREGEEAFFLGQLRARQRLLERMPGAKFQFFAHHLCHAASSFYTSPHTEAAILVVDGIGESASSWAGVGSHNQIEPVFSVEYPHSLGFLWEKTSEFLGFDRYDGPGKVMALGTLRSPVSSHSGVDYRERFASFVTTCPGGRFEIDPEVLRYRSPGFAGLERLFGPRRDIVGNDDERMALAAGLQQTTEDVLVHLASELWNRINTDRQIKTDVLCLAGGVSLNCVANTQVARRSPWKQLWIQPAAHDAGTALGAALLLWHQVFGRSQRAAQRDAFLGPDYSDAENRTALLSAGLRYRTARNLPKEVARMVADGRVVGWFQGRMEFGPRALGNRSILADPRRREVRSILNNRIKDREGFRPFAPSILAHQASQFFATPANGTDSLVPLEYMLLAVQARASGKGALAGVTHTNEITGIASARVHSVVPGCNPRYEELLAACQEELGVSAVLNTSFNVTEPIVCTPNDACKTFANSGLDALVLGSYIVEKS
jgi:carbamoyltransferase